MVAALAGLMLLLATQAAVAAETDELARWPMDEGTGQVAADVSGQGHHARLGGSPGADPTDPEWVPGRFGTGLRFVGTDDQFAEIGQPATLTPTFVSLEAWVRRLGTPGRWRYVVSNGGQGCDFSSFGLYSGSGGGLSFYVAGTGGYVTSPDAAQEQVWDGGWHYAVGTYDGQHVRLYLDGSELGHGSATALSIRYGLGSPARSSAPTAARATSPTRATWTTSPSAIAPSARRRSPTSPTRQPRGRCRPSCRRSPGRRRRGEAIRRTAPPATLPPRGEAASRYA